MPALMGIDQSCISTPFPHATAMPLLLFRHLTEDSRLLIFKAASLHS